MKTLQEKYQTEIVPALTKQFGYSTVMAVPRIEKVVVNMGAGRFRDEKDRTEIVKTLTVITGQRPSPRPAKKAIASFKTRAGLVVGYTVTLRGRRMYDFLSRMIDVALPRTRDFWGLDEKSFDRRGNLTVGIREHIVFPEMIGYDYRFLFGFEVTVVTTARTREEGVALLRLIGFPLKKAGDHVERRRGSRNKQS